MGEENFFGWSIRLPRKYYVLTDEVKEFLPERKCWRLVGGVLIEKTVGEVVPALK